MAKNHGHSGAGRNPGSREYVAVLDPGLRRDDE